LNKLEELEASRKKSTSSNSSTNASVGMASPSGTSVVSSSLSKEGGSYGNKAAAKGGVVQKSYSEYISFKPIKDHQLMSGPPSTNIYTRGATTDYTELTYKLIKCEAKLVKSTLEAHGFSYTESHDWNLLWLPQTGKPYLYDGLNEYQKINHFPSSFEIARKDKLCLNILKMQEKFGKRSFYIIPDTYLLPDEFADFFAEFHQLKNSEGKKPLWIIKPNSASQGKGIYLIDDINDIDLDES
jgi:hypothetical protein